MVEILEAIAAADGLTADRNGHDAKWQAGSVLDPGLSIQCAPSHRPGGRSRFQAASRIPRDRTASGTALGQASFTPNARRPQALQKPSRPAKPKWRKAGMPASHQAPMGPARRDFSPPDIKQRAEASDVSPELASARHRARQGQQVPNGLNPAECMQNFFPGSPWVGSSSKPPAFRCTVGFFCDRRSRAFGSGR